MQDNAKTKPVQDKDGDRLILLRFPSRPGHLKLVRSVVREASRMQHANPKTVQEVVLAVDEACQNMIRHAYGGRPDGEAELEILLKGDALVFRLRDFAEPVNKDKVKPVWPKELKPGGLGLCLIHEVMDEVKHSPVPSGDGNLLRMVKRIKRDNK